MLANKSIEETIGVEFMPIRKPSRKLGTRKMTYTRAYQKGTVKICRELPFDSAYTLAMEQLDSHNLHLLEYPPSVACSIALQILITRFPEMEFEQGKLHKFISKVGYKYQKQSNPFHNIFHGVTVMHGAYVLSRSTKFTSYFSEMQAFAFIVAALCHDLNHTGRTNIF